MEQEHPASMTARAVKQALPDRAIVTKDARVMMNTATSMFTLYLSAIAHDISTKNKRSTITLKDVLAALKETEFDHFVEPVEQCLADTKAADAHKRARKEAQKAGAMDGDGMEAGQENAPVVDNGTGEQEEVPMETDADLDGEQTIDEDEDPDEGDEEEDSTPENESLEEKQSSTTVPSSQTAATTESTSESMEDATMEESKSSDE